VENDVAPPSQVVPSYPKDLEAVVMATLRRDREHRVATASDLSAHLEYFGMRNGMMLGPRQVARYVSAVVPAERVLEPALSLVSNSGDAALTVDSGAFALPLARPRVKHERPELDQGLLSDEPSPFGGPDAHDTVQDPVVRGVVVPSPDG
jgi:serine/threonine-protein kinase